MKGGDNIVKDQATLHEVNFFDRINNIICKRSFNFKYNGRCTREQLLY